jgi:predicted amidophosphoribosyltransferase
MKFFVFLLIFKNTYSQAQDDLFKLPNLPQQQVAKIFLDKYANSRLANLESFLDNRKEVYRLRTGSSEFAIGKCKDQKIERDKNGNIISFKMGTSRNSCNEKFEPVHIAGAYAFGSGSLASWKRFHEDGTPLYSDPLIVFFEDFIIFGIDRHDGKLSLPDKFHIIGEKSVIKKISKKFSSTKDLQNTLNPLLQNYYKQMRVLMKQYKAEKEAKELELFREAEKRRKEEEAKREASKIIRVPDKFARAARCELENICHVEFDNRGRRYFVYSSKKGFSMDVMVGEPNGVIKVTINTPMGSGYKIRDYIEIEPRSLLAYNKEELEDYQAKIKEDGWAEVYSIYYYRHIRDERFEIMKFHGTNYHQIHKKLDGGFLYSYSEEFERTYLRPEEKNNQYRLVPIESGKDIFLSRIFIEDNKVYAKDKDRNEDILLMKIYDKEAKFPLPANLLKLIIYNIYNESEYRR